MSNISIKGKQCKGAEDLWERLTRKNVNYNSRDETELQKYMRIMELTNAHLEGYKAGGGKIQLLEELNSETLLRK